MSKISISRREFVGLTSVAAALGATSIGTKLEADPSNSVSAEVNLPPGRKLGTDAEMAMAKDWARSFSGSAAGTQAQAGSRLLPEVMPPPFSFIYGGRNSSDLLPGWKVEVKATRGGHR